MALHNMMYFPTGMWFILGNNVTAIGKTSRPILVSFNLYDGEDMSLYETLLLSNGSTYWFLHYSIKW